MVEPPGRAHPLTRRHPGKAAGLNSVIQVEVLPHTRVSPIDVTTHREEPVIAKETRVKEEIVVGNEADQRTETVHDTVRHTEVEDERAAATAPASSSIPSAAVEAFYGRFGLARRACRLLGDSPEAHTRSGRARHAGILALPPPARAGGDIVRHEHEIDEKRTANRFD